MIETEPFVRSKFFASGSSIIVTHMVRLLASTVHHVTKKDSPRLPGPEDTISPSLSRVIMLPSVPAGTLLVSQVTFSVAPTFQTVPLEGEVILGSVTTSAEAADIDAVRTARMVALVKNMLG